MSYNFFAYLSRMKYIARWSLMRSITRENIMEHSEQVAQIAHALGLINNRILGGNINADRLTTLAVFHETSEVITGDLPTPIKYYNNDIKTAYKALEQVANEKLVSMLPQELSADYATIASPDKNSYEYKLVKAADKLSAYIKCVEEVKGGNKEFVKAKTALLSQIKALALPEVEYFMDKFIKGFELTLDELD